MKPPSIIVIGASEGGLQALGTVLGALPVGFPASVLIVLHMHPNSPMQLAEILECQGSLPVSYAHSAASISLGHVYLAPPDHHLTIDPDGRLHLNKGPKEHHTRPAADPLFRSAAEAFGEQVIGIVLTGGDGDGAAGLRAIKAQGGVSIVQNPVEAREPSMPIHALQADHPDYCVNLDGIAPLLVQLVAADPNGARNAP